MLGKYEELDTKEDSDKHIMLLRRMGDDIGMPRTLTEYLANNNNIELKDKIKTKEDMSWRKKWQSFYKTFIYQKI